MDLDKIIQLEEFIKETILLNSADKSYWLQKLDDINDTKLNLLIEEILKLNQKLAEEFNKNSFKELVEADKIRFLVVFEADLTRILNRYLV